MIALTFLRPLCLLGLAPVVMIAAYWWFRPQQQNDWQKICDPRLLAYLQHVQGNDKWRITWACVMTSMFFMVIGLAGPSWHKEATPIGQVQKPVMVVMDLSASMLLEDIAPSRLERAKFLLEDMLNNHQDMQWGLMVFSDMPFLVSPMTNDVQNILNFLPVLSPSILPVGGYNVVRALDKAKSFLKQAGYSQGKLVVISSRRLSPELLDWQAKTQKQGFDLLWVYDSARTFGTQRSGDIDLMDIKTASSQIHPWLNRGFLMPKQEKLNTNKVMQWKDEGRWFVMIAMIFLMGVFRKGWFLRLWV